MLRAFLPKADKLAHLPVSPKGLDRGIFVSRALGLLIDIVKRERETQAARVLAGPGVTWGRYETTIECVF